MIPRTLHPLYFENPTLPLLAIHRSHENLYTATDQHNHIATVSADQVFQAVAAYKNRCEDLFALTDVLEDQEKLTQEEEIELGTKVVELFLENNPGSSSTASKLLKIIDSLEEQHLFLSSAFYCKLVENQKNLQEKIQIVKEACLGNKKVTDFTRKYLGALIALDMMTRSPDEMNRALDPLFRLAAERRFSSSTKDAFLSTIQMKFPTGVILCKLRDEDFLNLAMAGDRKAQTSMAAVLRILARHPDPETEGPQACLQYIHLLKSRGVLQKCFDETFTRVRDFFPLPGAPERLRQMERSTERAKRSHPPARRIVKIQEDRDLSVSPQGISPSPFSRTSPLEQTEPSLETRSGSSPIPRDFPPPPPLKTT